MLWPQSVTTKQRQSRTCQHDFHQVTKEKLYLWTSHLANPQDIDHNRHQESLKILDFTRISIRRQFNIGGIIGSTWKSLWRGLHLQRVGRVRKGKERRRLKIKRPSPSLLLPSRPLSPCRLFLLEPLLPEAGSTIL